MVVYFAMSNLKIRSVMEGKLEDVLWSKSQKLILLFETIAFNTFVKIFANYTEMFMWLTFIE